MPLLAHSKEICILDSTDSNFLPPWLVTPAEARNVRYFPPPLEQKWRIPILLELLDAREGISVIPGMDSAEIELMINHICTD